jgi:hypothetical protein
LDANDEVVETGDTLPVTPAKLAPTTQPEDESKLHLSKEELDEMIARAVASKQQEEEERIRREEAATQGNYKVLFEQAEEEKKQAKLALWRQQALNKFKLSEDLEDMLTGSTEEEVMKVAKKLRNSINKEIEDKVSLESQNPPPPSGGPNNPPRPNKRGSDAEVRNTIRTSLGIGKQLH